MDIFLNPNISTHKNIVCSEPHKSEALEQYDGWGGMRKKGLIKKDRDDLPLISVITVVKDGAETLRETLESVFMQSYGNIELIVFDGASEDGSLDIIKENEDNIDLWASGPDKGIYDAMNKALGFASGRYIHFLNSDDHYSYYGVLQIVMQAFKKYRARLVHTNILMLNPDRGYGWVRHSNVSKYYYLFKGIPQQAFFYEKSLFDDFGNFDLDYPIVADLEFLLRVKMKHKVSSRFLNIASVIFLTGGISGDIERKRAQREEVLKKYYSKRELLLLRNRLLENILTKNEMRGKKKSFIEKHLG